MDLFGDQAVNAIPNSYQNRLCAFHYGREVQTAVGTYYVLEKQVEIPQFELVVHGCREGREASFDLGPHVIDEEMATNVVVDQIVYLDIESTGLRPEQPLFLIGLLMFNKGQPLLKQFLARTPAEEKALLAAVQEAVAGFKVVVTYNGKKFDIPYIESRMRQHAIGFCFKQFHIDLLWHARRHYRDRLPNCRLVTLEEHILHMHRVDDVPGYQIPDLYRRFVRKQDARMLLGILEHNALDLISLSRLMFLVGPRRD
jgi:uncharacterized protein YprB with RNaseH-like and TPR domain